jgi:hypothetical protein
VTDTAPTPESTPTSTTPFSPEQLAVLTELIKGAVASAPSPDAPAPVTPEVAPEPAPAPAVSPVESLLSRLRLQATPNAIDSVKGWLSDHGVTLQ